MSGFFELFPRFLQGTTFLFKHISQVPLPEAGQTQDV